MDILYIMNVDWNWIKQRPHFIAELLSKKTNVHIVYQYRYQRTGLQQRPDRELDIEPIFVIPRGDRYKITSKINRLIKKRRVHRKIKNTNANVLYLTFPDQIDVIPKKYRGLIVYDCMDNHPEFVSNIIQKRELIRKEKQLIDRASVILATSNNLIETLKIRYGDEIEKKVHLIRNGFGGSILPINETKQIERSQLYTFAYFGTISSWFNFDYILQSLTDFQDIQYELYGPVAGVQIPEHERIHYHGTIEHDKLLENVKNADCLIMPFVVNDIIKAVDPVKLYEYINFNKNILVSEYDEIKRFSPFVHFYNSYSDFKKEICSLKQNCEIKYNNLEREEFLKKNSWNQRVEAIANIIDEEERKTHENSTL